MAPQAAIFLSAANIPWTIKPLIGFVSDSVPLLGYRRKSYLALAGLAGAREAAARAAGRAGGCVSAW